MMQDHELSQHAQRVRDFMVRAGQDVPDRPTEPTPEVRLLRAKLILEEAIETVTKGLGVEIYFHGGYDESQPLIRTTDDVSLSACGPFNIVELLDGVCDVKVVSTGTLLACGLADEEPQRLVDLSNLAKFTIPNCPDCGASMEFGSTIFGDGWYCTDLEAHPQVQYLPPGAGGRRRVDGKWQKPDDWEAPDLVAEIIRQTAEKAT